MIVVIADDFTGAAELAGISLRYGLKVELCLDDIVYENADVLIISTDSRSLTKQQAIAVTESTVKQLLQIKTEWIYKKIDSALRGYILEEARIQMKLMKKSKAFIMPANPSLGRIIKNGEYFINGVKISETGFENDPEFPIRSSYVKEILDDEVTVVKESGEEVTGIIIGEVETVEDYRLWVDKIDDQVILAGAGDFYTALLNKFYVLKPQAKFPLSSPHLYVCGTAFKERKEQLKGSAFVSYLPGVVNEEWLQRTGDIIKKHKKAIVAIDESVASASDLRRIMANAVKKVIERESIKEIFIEGGSTAAAVLQELNIKKLQPVNELRRGVVRMKNKDLYITVKPGSYELPEEIKRLYHI